MQPLGHSCSTCRGWSRYERLLLILSTLPESVRRRRSGKLTGAIELSHVHFRYDPEGPYIVKDLSLKIKAGEFIAFVGESGCGKSTLLRLLLGFEQTTTGSIYFDGQEIQTIDLRMVRQQMGVVMQQSRVMPTEIYRNIIGASSRTLDRGVGAGERSGLAEDVRNMPMGAHLRIGRRRCQAASASAMIARAIVNKPRSSSRRTTSALGRTGPS